MNLISFKLRRIFILLTLLTLHGLNQVCQAQKLNTDSLELVIISAKADSTRIDAMMVLANYQIKHLQQDSLGLETLDKARELSTLKNYPEGLFQSLITIGNYYRSKALWAESMDAYYQAIDAADDIEDEALRYRGQMMANNNLGGIFNFNGDFTTAINHRLKALEITETHTPDNYINRGIILLNIASDYRQLKIPQKSISYLNQTSAFFDSLSAMLKLEFHIEYFQAYNGDRDSSSALKNLRLLSEGIENYDLSEFQKMDYRMVHEELMGSFNSDFKYNSLKARNYFQNALELAIDLENPNKQAEYLYRIGETYLDATEYRQAQSILHAARDSSVKYNLKSLQLKVSAGLARVYEGSRDFENAVFYLSENTRLRGEIYDEEKSKEINFLEARYQKARADQEIAELKLKNTARELEAEKRNRTMWIGGLSSLVLLTFFGFGYRSGRQKRMIAEKEKNIQSEKVILLEKQQQVVSLQAMINGQESERSRVAKELHDSMGGMFSTLKMYLSTMGSEVPVLNQDPLYLKSKELISSAAEEVRRIAHDMMPEVLLKMGLTEAVRQLLNNLNAAGSIRFSFQHFGMSGRYAPSFERMLYRIIQELVNNILKHAGATEVLVQFMEEGNTLQVTVEDNGRGFDALPGAAPTAGLDSVKHRVQYLNGFISIDSEKTIGTTVVMEFLLDRS